MLSEYFFNRRFEPFSCLYLLNLQLFVKNALSHSTAA